MRRGQNKVAVCASWAFLRFSHDKIIEKQKSRPSTPPPPNTYLAMSKMIARSDGICPLLSALPVEIRLQIYDYVLFENGNFFSLDDEEGNSVPTLFPKLRAPRTRHQRRPRQTLERPDSQVANDARGIRTSRNGNIMSLLLTSKQM